MCSSLILLFSSEGAAREVEVREERGVEESAVKSWCVRYGLALWSHVVTLVTAAVIIYFVVVC